MNTWGEAIAYLCVGVLLFALAYGAGQLMMMWLAGW